MDGDRAAPASTGRGQSVPQPPTYQDPPPCRSPEPSSPNGPLAGATNRENILAPRPRPGSGLETQRRVDHDDYDSIAGFRSCGLRGRPGASRLSVSLANPRAVELRAVRGLLSLAERTGPARRFRR